MMTKEPTMNKRRIRDLAKLLDLLADPDSSPKLGFNISMFAANGIGDDSGHQCGTTACIAGWAVAAFGPEDKKPLVLKPVKDSQENTDAICCEAERLLGLDGDTACRLFMGGIHETRTPSDAAKVLRHLAKTGEVIWHE